MHTTFLFYINLWLVTKAILVLVFSHLFYYTFTLICTCTMYALHGKQLLRHDVIYLLVGGTRRGWRRWYKSAKWHQQHGGGDWEPLTRLFISTSMQRKFILTIVFSLSLSLSLAQLYSSWLLLWFLFILIQWYIYIYIYIYIFSY